MHDFYLAGNLELIQVKSNYKVKRKLILFMQFNDIKETKTISSFFIPEVCFFNN